MTFYMSFSITPLINLPQTIVVKCLFQILYTLFVLFIYSECFCNDSYDDPHVHVVDPGYDYAVCGPVEPQQSHLYDQPSEISENEPNAYEVPVSSSKNKKKE